MSNSNWCKAKKRDGGECHQPAMHNKRCRLHGGKTPAGIGSVHYKTGGHSKYLTAIPSRITDQLEQLRLRHDLLELRDEIALLDTRLLDVLSRIEPSEEQAPDALWLALQNTQADFKAAKARGKVEAMGAALVEIDRLITEGAGSVLAWREVYQIIEQRRKLVESVRRRALEGQEYLTSKEAYLLFNVLLSIVNEYVIDRDTKEKIQHAVLKLMPALNA